jgi:hypothetical protein
MIRSFADIFEIWTIKELADRLPAKYQTVAGMKLRGWVASAWWGRLIEIARQDGQMLDAEMLLAFARQRGPRANKLYKNKNHEPYSARKAPRKRSNEVIAGA